MEITDEEFLKMKEGLMASIRRYPNCIIANCDCNSRQGERIANCHCLCHIDEIKKEMEEEAHKKT